MSRLLALLMGVVLTIAVVESMLWITGIAPPPPAPSLDTSRRWVGEYPGVLVPDAARLWRLKPFADTAPADKRVPGPGKVRYRIDSRGFRGPEFTAGKPPAVFRIVTLGDANTFGSFVDEERTFPRLLPDFLSEVFPGQRFEVINAGIPGYTSTQGLRLLEQELLAYRPDFVVVYFGSEGEREPAEVTDHDRMKLLQTSPGRGRLLKSRLFSWLERVATMDRLPGARPLSGSGAMAESGATRRVPLPRFVADVAEIHRLATAHAVETVTVVPPHSAARIAAVEDVEDYTHAARFIGRSLPVVDVDAAFPRHGRDALFAEDRIHLNEQGHRLLARLLSDEIRERFWPVREARGVWYLDAHPNPPVRQSLPRMLGRGSHFDGTGPGVDLGLDLDGWRSLTIAFWVSPAPPLLTEHGIIFDNGHTPRENCVVQMPRDGRAFYWVCMGPGVMFELPPDRWSHVVAMAGGAGNNLRVYVNGSLVKNGRLPAPLRLSRGGVTLGSWQGPAPRHFRGRLEEFAIWDRLLAEHMVLRLMCQSWFYTRHKGDAGFEDARSVCEK